MIPRGFADDVRQQADIVRIVSDYVALKKRGANWIACCPFHSEKTPSFNVHPGKGIFKCFGCSVGGTVFDFVMQIEGCSFLEAVRTVAEKSGIPVPDVKEAPPEARRAEEDRKRVFELNSWAVEFFEQQLGLGPEGRVAAEYLGSRGIEPDTRERLRLGYAPNAWDALSSHLASRGASRDEIARSGLVTLREGEGGAPGRYYDRFRGRVIFPIADAQGRFVAFGGRALGDDGPKYLNSPETPVYTKGNHLFGIAHVRDAIRRTGFAILVEGYLDFVIPFQAGVDNIVASLGTALTEQQARLLRRYMEKPQVVVNFDADAAGQDATARSFEVLLAQGFRVNVLALPEGKDPDEFVRKNGAEQYRALLKTSLPFVEYAVWRARGRHDIERPSGKVDAMNEVLPFLAQIENRNERDEYAKRVAEQLRLEEGALREELRRAAARRETKVNAKRVAPQRELTDLERRLLLVVFADPGVRSLVLPSLEDEDVTGWASEPIFRALREAHLSGHPIGYSEISEQLPDGARQDLASLVALELDSILVAQTGTWDERLRKEATYCLDRIQCQRYERERAILQHEIQDAERDGNEARVHELLARKIQLNLLLAKLKANPG
jgi:DNA primase